LDSVQTLADLDRRFSIAGKARVVAGNGGLTKVVVSAAGGDGEMYLHGGHVTSWMPKGAAEVFYLSAKSLWQDGRAIRGGVPVCFPWFADKADDRAAPAHGFVRTKSWQLEAIELTDENITVSMFTESAENTRKWWPFDFRLACRATFGTRLKLELTVINTGATSLRFEEALHSYFSVGDAQRAFVQGLDATHFIDKTDRHADKEQRGEVRIVSETDRVYLNTPHDVDLFDRMLNRRVIVQKENSLTTVIWNPWAEKSHALSDLGAGKWKDFICIETSNVGPYAVQLAPGQQHTLATLIQVAQWQDG
jgi:glucose-6-phosphate 1-epimerase